MANNGLHLFVTMLAFTFFLSLIDFANSRAILMAHGTQAIPSSEDTLILHEFEKKQAEMARWEMEENDEVLNRRMDIEIKDYPGPGPNQNQRSRGGSGGTNN